MSKIQLVDTGFELIPEGNYTFQITNAVYKERFNKIEITYKNKQGQTLKETYSLKSDGGRKAFSYLAKTAMSDYNLTDISPDELIGKFINADVEHSVVPARDEPGKTMTFANLKNKQEASGFDGTSVVKKQTPLPDDEQVKPDLSFLD